MKVYAHYVKINGIEYRWKTLLQLGNSWEVCGTVIMKNPGSSHPRNWNNDKPIPINNIEILKSLNRFDEFNSLDSKEWFDFSVDPTMRHVGNLIEAYLRYNKQKEEGIIQIFNLFNVIDKSLGEAIQKYDPQVANTIEDDINSIKQYSKLPIYIGWGDLWRNKLLYDNAKRLFDSVKPEIHYLDSNDIGKNNYYHPQYLLGIGKNRNECIKHYRSFLTNNRDNQNEFNRILLIKDKINKDGTNQWIDPDGILIHEYYCKGKNGKYVKGNGTIAVGLKLDNKGNKYVLSILSNGNHPDKFVAKVQEICDESKLFKMDAKFTFVADVGTDDSRIVDFFNLLLSKMKDYRETDIRE